MEALNELSVDDFGVEDSIELQKPVEATAPADKEESEDSGREPEFSKEELTKVFDDILFDGEYVEDIKIKGRLDIKFKSRSAKEASEVARQIDKANFKMISTMEQHIAMFNLAYSLVSYMDKDLSSMPAMAGKGEESRYNFISNLPGGVCAAMYFELSKFDSKVQAACMEGAENF